MFDCQALLGPVAAAAYNLTFQLGFATTQICESVAVAVQTLLAREVAGGGGNDSSSGSTSRIYNNGAIAARVRHLINGSILVGGIVAGSLSLVTFLQMEGVLRSLTTDVNVREASAIIFPAVLITQGKLFIGKREFLCNIDYENLLTKQHSSQRTCISRQWDHNGWLGLEIYNVGT